MLLPTHMVFGQAVYFAACISTGHTPNIVESIGAVIASSIPDLDNHRSIVGRMVPFISGPLEYQFGHRTMTHSLIVHLIVGFTLYFTLPFGWFLAIIAGWTSHTLADMMTPSGVAWFWPSRVRCVIPGNAEYRMKAMGWGELWFLCIVGAISFLLLWITQAQVGTAGVIRSAIGDVSSARQQYDAEKGSNEWSLRVKGRDNSSYQDISGEYEVIGPWRESSFLVSSDGKTKSACKSSACDWYTEHSVLVKGKAIATTTRAIKAEKISRQDLIDALLPLEGAGKVFLVGSLSAKNVKSNLPTVDASAESVSFHYATMQDLHNLPAILREVDLIAQVRHDIGVIVPEVIITTDIRSDRSELLKRWIE